MTSFSRLPALFISHGGGPWPYVEAHRQMYPHTEKELRRLPPRLAARPTAVLIMSAHWEAGKFSVATAARPGMEYDYGGFPAHTYQLSYPAPGEPNLAKRARKLIADAGIDVTEDSRKGFDHGVFVPLSLLYPNADIPILMVAVKSGYDPDEHFALGRALAPLREEGVLIIGSGSSYHNMHGMNRDSSTAGARAFTQYLDDAITLPDMRARERRLLQWEHAPSARFAHPREDHLAPLLTVAGAAGDDKGLVLFSEDVLKVPMTSYVFGEIKAD